jgi:hypothetical protein
VSSFSGLRTFSIYWDVFPSVIIEEVVPSGSTLSATKSSNDGPVLSRAENVEEVFSADTVKER